MSAVERSLPPVGGPVQLAVSWASQTGESPMWHPREQVLYWCDVPGRQLNRFDPASGALVHWDVPQDLACVAPCLDGGLLLAMRDGLWHFDPRGTPEPTLARLAKPPYDPAKERFNDGKCDPQGRFWVGTIYEPRTPPRAALHCFSDGELHRRAEGITNSNGLAWSVSGRTMYWADTTSHTVFAFDFEPDTGALSRQRVFHRFAPKPLPAADGTSPPYGGRPDGAAVDTEDCYWVAMYEGSRIVRLSPEGELLADIALPVRCPTMVGFGGPDLRTLYITTARAHRPADELAREPWAGGVLSVRLPVAGLPVSLFT